MVIHLQGPAKGTWSKPQCQKCGYKRDGNGGIVKTCLDCFLDGHSLYIYEYGVSVSVFQSRQRGTCSVSHSKPPHEVIQIATQFVVNGFGNYDAFANNCEDFARYCKTGSAGSLQVMGHVENFAKVALPISLLGGPIGILVGAGATAAIGLSYGLAKLLPYYHVDIAI
ncbi:hypothetical protein COLO4_15386 [Corchorus olitorius]|uniref:LRAT domain-containing protein n=1 Tax=Corchorus olitorius TaxID=93759 RepID=A0A1R3JN12_9ROSI|nr:hypothetical protein COLO4_15386 [Corchorus olitorius]